MFDIQTNPFSHWAARRLLSQGVLGEAVRGMPSLHKLWALERLLGGDDEWQKKKIGGMQGGKGKCWSSAEQEAALRMRSHAAGYRTCPVPPTRHFENSGLSEGAGLRGVAGINAAVSHKHRVGN